MPIIDLTETINPVEYEPTESYREDIYVTNLTDGYEQLAVSGSSHLNRNWQISKTNLTETERNSLESILLELKGYTSFLWSPLPTIIPKDSYVCTQFSFVPIAPDGTNPTTKQIWKLQATFELDKTGQCEAFRNGIDKTLIINRLNNAIEFMLRYTHNIEPMFANSDFAIRNNFHKVEGRQSYLPYGASTSEGVFTTIAACCEAFKVTGNIKYKNYALAVANYALNNIYPKSDPFSYTDSDKFLCHWVVNAGSAVPSMGKTHPTDYFKNGYRDINVSFNNGVGILQSSGDLNRDRLARVYKAYTGKLYFESVTSPIIPGSGVEYEVEYYVINYLMEGTKFRYFVGNDTSAGLDPNPTNEQVGLIKLKTPYTGTLKVVLMTYNTEMIERGDLTDAFPAWRKVYKK